MFSEHRKNHAIKEYLRLSKLKNEVSKIKSKPNFSKVLEGRKFENRTLCGLTSRPLEEKDY